MIKDKKVLLMGNPNVGKSTVFNEITGSHQHTGNWTGKTVGTCEGRYTYKFTNFRLVDLPGTYSLLSSSDEERIARDYLCFEDYDCIVCVIDATNLERNLNLVLQVLELTDRVVVLLNLCDEAKKKNIEIDNLALSKSLGVPIIRATARSGKGINELLEAIFCISNETLINETAVLYYSSPIETAIKQITRELKCSLETDKKLRFFSLRLIENDESFNKSFKAYFGNEALLNTDLSTAIASAERQMDTFAINPAKSVTQAIYEKASHLAEAVSKQLPSKKERAEKVLDNILLGKYTAVPIMLLLFAVVLWLTVAGSNYPSEFLREVFDGFETRLAEILADIGAPPWVTGLFVNGILKVLLWVIAVMLPPMAIFFPLFALLEDFGILPRIAFNLDGAFEKCGACGKQALTTCMGYGCNAVGVTGARIIDSPRGRLIAVITNSLTPCNGRFPLLIAIISMFFCSNSFTAAGILLILIIVSVAMTFLCSKLLSTTILKGVASSFVLELPPYRRPKILRLLCNTLREKILFVLLRAAAVSAPAGLIIWLMANFNVGENSLLCAAADFLNPFGELIGLDGVILIAFILGFPANEIVIPIALMAYLSSGEISDYSSLESLKNILTDNGWTWVTALCTCVFSMFHFPCSTTLITIYKETKSLKWSALSVLVPLSAGIISCAVINLIFG